VCQIHGRRCARCSVAAVKRCQPAPLLLGWCCKLQASVCRGEGHAAFTLALVRWQCVECRLHKVLQIPLLLKYLGLRQQTCALGQSGHAVNCSGLMLCCMSVKALQACTSAEDCALLHGAAFSPSCANRLCLASGLQRAWCRSAWHHSWTALREFSSDPLRAPAATKISSVCFHMQNHSVSAFRSLGCLLARLCSDAFSIPSACPA
jgi:hypothetical protein